MKEISSRRGVEGKVEHGSLLTHDETLMKAVSHVRRGIEPEQNFRVLDARLRPRLHIFFRSCRFSTEDSEDLVQKTLTRVYLHVGQLRQEEKFVAWLFVTARNVMNTALARQEHESQWLAGDMEMVAHVPDPCDVSHQQIEDEQRAAVEVAIERLPAQQRQCLLLRVNSEMSYEEIAGLLRLSPRTVRNHLAEAKKNLRRLLARQTGNQMSL